MEIWNEIQPYLVEILGSIGIVITIITTKAKKTKKEKLQAELDKMHSKTEKDKKKLQENLRKEIELEEAIANEK